MVSRRKIIGGSIAGGGAIAAGGLSMPAVASGHNNIRLGYVTPRTGPLASFAAADTFVIDSFREFAAKRNYHFEVIVKDSQSNPNRAAEVARELIIDDQINLMLVSSTPETTNPVSTTCEAEEVPCLSTVAPWQPWFIGQQANPGDPASWRGFQYSYHFFWGLEDIISVFTNMWGSVPTNKSVGGLFPNDGDGNAWGDPQVGFPPVLDKLGYRLNDPGRYQNLSDDFTSQINSFKSSNAEIVTGVMIPPDFTTFWTQAQQQDYRPRVVSMGKAILFPQSLRALGSFGNNLSSEVWWSPFHPFRSSLTRQTSKELAASYTAATGEQWTQPIGFAHALFELAVDIMRRVDDPTDADEVAATINKTNLNTIVGNIQFNNDRLPPFAARNVAKTPLVGGQWRLRGGGNYDLEIVNNKTAPDIPATSQMQLIG